MDKLLSETEQDIVHVLLENIKSDVVRFNFKPKQDTCDALQAALGKFLAESR